MRLKVIQKILGLLLSVFSLTLLPPLVISLVMHDGAAHAFALAAVAILCAGLMLWLPVRRLEGDLKLRDGFLVVVLFWFVLGASGAIPFLIADQPHMPLADAVFESMSGLTTTGATVIVGIDALPPSILFYRQLLQWLGGMGIIVLAVAILPMLGVGGMQLYRAETPGPMKDSKLTPRITETAKTLWYIYVSLTVACAVAYYMVGMSAFDAIGHSFSTVAIGGFSTHDASIGYFDSVAVEGVAVFFMFVAGINFSLHFLAWRYRNLKPYAYDSEFRMYAGLLGAVFVVCTIGLALADDGLDFTQSLRNSLFHTVSIGTTTGFSTTTFQNWPHFLPLILLFLSFVGGCAGSTGGGIKVIRCLLLYKQGVREIRRLIHPNAIITIRMGDRSVADRVVDAVWGFFATYVAVFVLLLLGLMATGLDQVTAFSAVAACLNNLGPGLGAVSLHYGEVSNLAKYLLCLAMLLGRLEIFTLLVLLTPSFWRS
ncbi:MAG: potassium transporter [Gammaproteobacteria bacterium]|nr:potassium transporter [Gammaproteobacteria bacterium]